MPENKIKITPAKGRPMLKNSGGTSFIFEARENHSD